MTVGTRRAKAEVRSRVLAARRAAGPAARVEASERISRLLLDLPDVAAARCVAAYLSFGTEPSTAEFLAALSLRTVTVLVPVLREDLDLDWAIYDGVAGVTQTGTGLPQPRGERLGRSAVADADVVVAPALAVGEDGTRLGRGGGSYDRALARVRPGRPVVALLYDGELLPDVPREEHDRRVDVVVTPTGVHRMPRAAGPA